ncbi:hypothetical protein SLUN_28845 [Streptomyces lunaelactis]|uniref:Lipoprotein n=1 Tax=Streptomyces lunaelactis TaxID=1535768 RepID=A0A2R4T935_9ACTN|nr:hypothetical protein [Streptomyces lunaelactis]AVZ75617.1 hypothetical protein SLUN_28845 [Streptomyces lunaelactis]NUK89820.1 hypothetical protein [Streptomyces lunaelactis]NUL04969.1 hypothetical protein [Streptomyces lunaelactis]
MGRTGTTRRRALMVTGAAAASLLTGCSTEEPEGRRTSGSAPDSGRTEAALRRRLAAVSGALRDQYDAVIAQHPTLAGQLAPLRAAVGEHVTALGGAARVAPPVPVPSDAPGAVKALAAAERRTSDTHVAALLDAEPELARLLASVAAAGAAHAYLLTKGGGR